MRALIAPDKFKGTLTAPAAALAMAEGIRAAVPDAVVSLCPVADGGEGTLAALLDALGGSKAYLSATDPWDRPARFPVAFLDDGTVCCETSSSASGDPRAADSHGIGVLLKRVLDERPGTHIALGIGGTASTDGGTGLARALGWRFLDANGRDLPPGGAALSELYTIAPPERPIEGTVVGLCDVDAPLTGPTGSAARFAPQKGAGPEDVVILERGLERLAEVTRSELGIDLGALEGAGAGGGIGAGVVAFCAGSLVSGFDHVASALRLRTRIEAADLVITGEGRFDEQSLQGKASAGVARLSHETGVPCLGIFGSLGVPLATVLGAGFSDALTIPVSADGVAPAAGLTRAAEALMLRQPV